MGPHWANVTLLTGTVLCSSPSVDPCSAFISVACEQSPHFCPTKCVYLGKDLSR